MTNKTRLALLTEAAWVASNARAHAAVGLNSFADAEAEVAAHMLQAVFHPLPHSAVDLRHLVTSLTGLVGKSSLTHVEAYIAAYGRDGQTWHR